MSSTETKYVRGDSDSNPDESADYVLDKTVTKTDQETYNLGVPNTGPYRRLHITLADGFVANDGTDTEAVTVEVVDGLEVARGAELTDATVLDYDGDVTMSIDGVEVVKTLANGSVSFNLTAEKSAGKTIDIVAKSLADHPAESDSATIEVVSA